MTPVKPFNSYKWRWLSVQPSESLLQAPIFLGVLRALSRHEGDSFSSIGLRADLANVQTATKSPVTLARDPIRNLFRNSGQYWRGTGLIAPGSGIIHLTDLGRGVAEGRVTQGEFAALMVQQTTLPNPATYSPDEVAKWQTAGLQIKPLKLILEIIEEIGRKHGGAAAASLSNNELIEVIIPLAGIKASVSVIAQHVVRYRHGQLNVSGWPDCAPEANDKRLAREFLLFLANFGLLRHEPEAVGRDEQRFYMDELFDVDAATESTGTSIFADEANAEEAVENVRHSSLPSIIERQRTITRVLARTGQSKFRSRIMKAYQNRCFLTGETISEILEAAHIVPVTNNGADHEDNGFCMRVDVHRLYDSGNLRIRPDGSLMLSDAVASSPNYQGLPAAVTFPPFVNPANVVWRDSYL